MKRIIALTCLFCLIALPVFAGTKTLNFTWNQVIPSDMGGWKLYMGTTAGQTTTVFATIPYGGTQQTQYASSQTLTVPDGQVTTRYFTLTAFDTSGNESAKSNEVQAIIDFQAPGVPTTLTVTVTSGP